MESESMRSSLSLADTDQKRAYLNSVFRSMSHTILRFQSPTTGLFPADTDCDCKVGDVRTSVYCALSIWSLHLSYKRQHCEDNGRTHLLGQTAVKTMRGVLTCWMYQIPKMKEFLSDQVPKNSLHIRFDIVTGQVLPDNDDYPHLQLDCISLFLLSLVQMIASGLQLIYTCDEVDFIQNLVYCVERAYRIADFGMWGRGTKYNNGTPELNASNVGMAKAAMEAVNGFNLFGEHGAAWTVIYVDIDAHMRNRTVFEGLMPRESSSKIADAALLPVLSWPCFAIHDAKLKEKTMERLVDSLKGGYGMKRFHRDGYGTSLEDSNRPYYSPSDIKMFDGVECEWPFLTFFLIIDCIFEGDDEKAVKYLKEVEPFLENTPQGVIVPQYFYVPTEFIELQKDNPEGRYKRPTDEGTNDKYFLWGQSVYIIMRLLVDNLLPINEIDPIKRHLSALERPRFSHRYAMFEGSAKDRLIQVAVIAESVRLQQALATHGIPSQTPTQIEPIQIWSPNQLKKALKYMGINYRLSLSGRPERPVGILGTSMFYRVCGQTIISYPLLFEVNDFYISQDLNCVIDQVQADIETLSNTWSLSGRPTYLIMLTESMVQAGSAKHLIDMLSSFKSGVTKSGVRVRLGRLQSMVSSGTKEHLDFLTHFNEQRTGAGELSFDKVQDVADGSNSEIKVNLSTRRVRRNTASIEDLGKDPDWKLVELYRSTEDFHVQSQSLTELSSRHGTSHLIDGRPISEILERIRLSASHSACPDWSVVRLCSALTGKVTDSLAPSITTMLVRGKLVTLGMFGHKEHVISKPINPAAIKALLYNLCQPIEPREVVLQQEMILLLGHLLGSKPELFDGILKIRIGWIIHAMQYSLQRDTPSLSIYTLSPSEVSHLLQTILAQTTDMENCGLVLWQRRLLGCLGCVPRCFCEKIWYILERTKLGIQLYDYLLPQEPTLSDLTLPEMNFALLVEEMLSVIIDPLHRHVVVEVLTVIAVLLERNPEVGFEKPINIQEILDQALALFKATTQSSDAADKEVRDAFYETPTTGVNGTYSFIAKAVCAALLDNVLQTGQPCKDCTVM